MQCSLLVKSSYLNGKIGKVHGENKVAIKGERF